MVQASEQRRTCPAGGMVLTQAPEGMMLTQAPGEAVCQGGLCPGGSPEKGQERGTVEAKITDGPR